MVRKTYHMDENTLEILQHIRSEKPELENDSAALRYIVAEYQKLKSGKQAEKDMKAALVIGRSNEEKLDIILDVLNSLLVAAGQETCVPATYMESPVITKSREYRKDRIAHLKQRKDFENKKHG